MEFVNQTVRKIFDDNGTFHRFSCPYTPQQNGRAERKHRHIVETGLAMLFNAHVPGSYWVDAFTSATFIINRLPTPLLKNKSPFQLLFNQDPQYENFRTYGCQVFPYLRDYSQHKLAPRSIPCIFIGYSSQHKGYQCLDPTTSRVFVTRHARFNEMVFPSTITNDSPHVPPLPNFMASDQTHQDHMPDPNPEHEPIAEAPSSPVQDAQQPDHHVSINQPPPVISDSAHPMITRSKVGTFKPKHRADLASLTTHSLRVALTSTTEPRGFKTAAKDPKWMAAMHEELQALQQNQNWTLVPRPSSTNTVGSKWVYRIKYHSDGAIERYKARLVAQGYTQIPSLDYSHMFSPVVKAATVRIVLSLAVLNNWKLHQLDVKNAFLNGTLDETVFMEQPPGFTNPQFPNHVCKLSKALYGLKQAPHAWFQHLSTFLLSYGFTCSRADTSLFVLTRDSCIMYLLVYVDDLILTGNDETTITTFISRLNHEFAIKDLGDLNYFLGLEVAYMDNGLFLTQSKYASDILKKADLYDSKPVSTPLPPHASFTTDGLPFKDPTLYRSLVGALQYLTITRPDLSYVVNQVSQFLKAPTADHFQSVKRILRYVKGTISFGLTYSRPHTNSIHGYSDADWARCLDTRRSTYGYSIYLGENIVSWSAKKQPTVSRSSCESEYRVMANTAAEIVWITHLLRELHALPPDRPTLLCDNKSALFMTQNPVSHKRAKHIDLDYHFIRELVSSDKFFTKFVPTNLQVADIITKSLLLPQFETFRTMLRLGPSPFRLKGGGGY
ncbi:hypothetical protein L6452_39837 [Arctium lappa]|uniref:Uncharacterized protein n=1 Tax=Arctium lappa TaxID=4217 RepID=A0ACB8XTL5_ARCLA|nr:hypothetical protein L6452_39837 [Arctium lappa]